MRRLQIILLGLGLCLAAPPAGAHALLTGSQPAVGGTTAPTAILRLFFSEGIEVRFSKVAVTTAEGAEAGPAGLALDPADDKILIVTLPKPLTPGAYHLHWQVVSVDTHHTRGDFDFTVR